MTPHHAELTDFMAQQWLGALTPANWLPGNPVVLHANLEKLGARCARAGSTGWKTWPRRPASAPPPSARRISRSAATWPSPRRGGDAQRPRRADPLHAADQDGASRAGADRALVDHEVLHPRSLAAQLAGALAGVAGARGLHAVVEEPRRGRPRADDGRLSAARPARCPARHREAGAQTAGARDGLLPGRHADGDRRGGAGRRGRDRRPQAHGGAEDAHAAGRAGRLLRAGRAGPVHRREPGRHLQEQNRERGYSPARRWPARSSSCTRAIWCGRGACANT